LTFCNQATEWQIQKLISWNFAVTSIDHPQENGCNFSFFWQFHLQQRPYWREKCDVGLCIIACFRDHHTNYLAENCTLARENHKNLMAAM
jgi:hypothetical protein